MGQLSALVWKNFCWIKRHPIQTFFFYSFTIVIGGLIIAALKLAENFTGIYESGCESRAQPFFPSNPTILSQLFCHGYPRCYNNYNDKTEFGYERIQQPFSALEDPEAFHKFLQFRTYASGDCNYNHSMALRRDDNPSPVCYGTTYRRKGSKMNLVYVKLIDYVLIGRLAYYPKNNQTDTIIQMMSKQLSDYFMTPETLEGISRVEAQQLYAELYVAIEFEYGGRGRRFKRQAGDKNGSAGKANQPNKGLPNPNRLDRKENRTGEELPSFEEFYAQLLQAGLADVNVSRCAAPLHMRSDGFETEEESIKFVKGWNQTLNLPWAIINFNDTSSNFRYKIIKPQEVLNLEPTLYLQSLIESTVVEYQTGFRIDKFVEMQPFPVRCKKSTSIYQFLSELLPFLLVLGMLGVSTAVPAEMCTEKASGLVEVLLITGVSRLKLKLSWLLFGLGLAGSLCVFNCLFLKFGTQSLMETTNFLLLLLLLLSYAAALICFTFVLASVFKTGESAASGCALLLLAAYFLPGQFSLLPTAATDGIVTSRLTYARIASLFVPSVAIQIGVQYVIAWEIESVGLDWGNLFESPYDRDPFYGVGEALLYLLIQIPMHTLISIYLDKVNPGKYGIKLPFYFFLMPSYWMSKGGAEMEDEGKTNDGKAADIEQFKETDKEVGIQIHKLVKSYGSFRAVDHLSIQFYKHDVTAFLGHNGAGKSTTMNILTGMLTPTSGTAYIDGKNISTHMGEIRKNLGYCPQYDIVYPNLTVKEHMKFFGSLRNIDPQELTAYSDRVFETMKMNLKSQQKTTAKNLSGGMKRKLSIALAFLGGPTTVILDEPTSAIDPFSRRAIWDVILKHRSKATILLSTHHMQEADMLGDKIAIIDSGALRCFGTSMYLKAQYGKGFTITCAHQAVIDANELQQNLSQHIPVMLTSSNYTETLFNVKMEDARSEKIIDAFHHLEDSSEQIVSFGISEATIEQVFLTVTTHGVHTSNERRVSINFAGASEARPVIKPKKGNSLVLDQMLAMLLKRALIALRDPWSLFLAQISYPIIAVCLMLLLVKVDWGKLFSVKQEYTINLHNPWTSGLPSNIFFFHGSRNSSLHDSLHKFSVGSTCATGKPRTCSATASMVENTVIQNNVIGADNQEQITCRCRPCPSMSDHTTALTANLPSNDLLVDVSSWTNPGYYLKHTFNRKMIGGFEELTVSNRTPAAEMLFGNRTENIVRIWAGDTVGSYGMLTKRRRMLRRLRPAILNSYYNVELRAILLEQGRENTNDYSITLSTEEKELLVADDTDIYFKLVAVPFAVCS